MSSVKRRINSTGRKRIPRDRIDIRLVSSKSGEVLSGKATARLDGLGLPPSAGVVIDAYYRSTGMRFECGTVGDLRIPALLVLDEIDQSGAVLFRVKVFDRDASPGKLLGAAERISPREADDLDGKRSIFPIIQRDLGPEVWRVEFADDTGPRLILNSQVPGITHRILGDSLAQGLLLPEALRIVLKKLADDPATEDTDEPDWKEEWIEFAQTKLGLEEDLATLSLMSQDDKDEWINQAVSIFCEQAAFVTNIKAMKEGDHPRV
jgi:hypothetical protein